METRPGSAEVVVFRVENPSSSRVENLSLTLSGIPGGWASVEPEQVSLEGGDSLEAKIYIDVPLSALPGDHKAVLQLSNGGEEASAFFIFRIKPYPQRFEKPAVLREVYLNESGNRTEVRVRVQNSGVAVERLEVVEEIPKEVARSVADIRFSEPVAVIEPDPVVAWLLRKVEPYGEYTLRYEVNRIAKRYSTYIYWPFKQINLFYTRLRAIDLLQFSGAAATYAKPGEAAEVKFRLLNPSPEALKLRVKLAAPAGWEVSPKMANLMLLPSYSRELKFRITPPGDAVPGSYTLTAVISSDEGEVQHPLTLILVEKRKLNLRRLFTPFLGLAALILLVHAALVRYRGRERYRREVVEAIGRIRERMGR